jgi:hypothetical protein
MKLGCSARIFRDRVLRALRKDERIDRAVASVRVPDASTWLARACFATLCSSRDLECARPIMKELALAAPDVFAMDGLQK